jgi:hypothetical protein
MSKRGQGIIYTSIRHCPDTVNRWFARRNNANNAWNFNGTNGNLNNNNVNNANRCQAVTNLRKCLYTLRYDEGCGAVRSSYGYLL